jgi:hypothetical protein
MLVVPFLLLVYISRNLLKGFFGLFPVSVAYVSIGFIFGMLVEVFAIWQNLPLPIGERKLFNPDPALDLIIAAGFYFVVSVTLYLFAKRYNFSKKSIIAVTAFYAIVIEQLGAVFVMGLANPFLWVYVAFVYATWTVTPYLLLRDRLPERPIPSFKVYPILLAALWVASFLGSIVGTLLSKAGQ